MGTFTVQTERNYPHFYDHVELSSSTDTCRRSVSKFGGQKQRFIEDWARTVCNWMYLLINASMFLFMEDSSHA